MNALSKGRRLAKWNPGLAVVEGLGLILGHVHVPLSVSLSSAPDRATVKRPIEEFVSEGR